LATEAGYQILKAGGGAVDAAIAVQMVLALVEPQSSGIGGGAFLLLFDGKTTEAFDGRETAPAGADEDLFLGPDRKPMSFHDAVVGGRAVGTPGVVRMLELAHRRHGRLAWHRLFEPAIGLAESGFPVSARMHTLLTRESRLREDPDAAAYFYDQQGHAWPEGHVLKNPELAAVLRRIAKEGSNAFYDGEVAQAIVNKVSSHPNNPGRLALADLAGYHARVRDPLCFDYRVKGTSAKSGRSRSYRICGMPPPSSGAMAMGQILGMLTNTPAAAFKPARGTMGVAPGADWLHLYAEAARLAFADRAVYLADPDFVPAPAGRWTSLLDPDYLMQRARLIATGPDARRMPEAPSGVPDGIRQSPGAMPEQPEHGTSHISIIDARGNALAMTSSVEDAWGARLMVNRGQGLAGGFLLNNQLTDFSFEPRTPTGAAIANRVEPGKRPRSSMSPTLVFDRATGRLVMSAGSPGGAYIYHFTTKLLYSVFNWGLDVQSAIDLPNFAAFSGPLVLEEHRFPASTLKALRARGHKVIETPLPSGLQAIQTRGRGYFGGADPRREGRVMGD
jgi:gamma-glutamyltranspeptidase/glutathione hydrolase